MFSSYGVNGYRFLPEMKALYRLYLPLVKRMKESVNEGSTFMKWKNIVPEK